jgi:gliding motility-associated-like protein
MGSCFACAFSQSQTVFTEDFESGAGSWFQQGPAIENEFIFDECAGNGPSDVGTNSAYISNGGAAPDCTPLTGITHYGYENSAASEDSIIVYHLVDATCLSSVEIDFDYRITGDAGNDYAYLVYSTDGGVSWIEVGSELSNQLAWTSGNEALPVSLAGTSFLIGFKFRYDNLTAIDEPLAFDNVVVKGDDSVAPLISCKGVVTYSANSSCEYVLSDILPLITSMSDNCTDSVDLGLSMTPPLGTVLTLLNTNIPAVVTVTDAYGNQNTCNVDLRVRDNTAPIVTCPTDTNVSLGANCDYTVADYTSLLQVQENCTAINDLIFTQLIAPGTIFNTHGDAENIGFEVEDEEGNIGTCSFNLLISDTTKPVLDCPIDTVVYLNSTCQSSLGNYSSEVSVADNCASIFTVSQSPITGNAIVGHGTVQLVTMTSTDGNGNSGTCTFNVTALDTLAPTIVCPGAQDQDADVNCESLLLDYSSDGIEGLDNCSVTSVSQSPVLGTTISGPTNEVTLTISDAIGNSNSCVFNVAVVDVTAPDVVCPNDTTLPVNASCLGILPDYTGLGSATDNCAITTFSPMQSPAVGASSFGAGSVVVVTLTADDDEGNPGSCTFNVTLIDTIAPNISCPSNDTENADANCEFLVPDYTGGISVNDNCSASGNILISQSVAIGDPISSGVNEIILTATDEGGNEKTCSFEITVLDITMPNISCPADQGVYSDANCDAVLTDLTSQVIAADNCSLYEDLTITQSPLPGLVVATTQLIDILVVDEAGNSNTCSFTVTKADSLVPNVICPGDIDVPADASCNYVAGDYLFEISATDNCSASGNLIFGQSPPNTTVLNGLTEVTMSAEDEAGNIGTCTFNLVPTDVIAPVITTCPDKDTLYVNTSCEAVVPDYSSETVVSDACGGTVFSQSEAVGSILAPGVYNVTMTATDPGNNSDQCIFDIEVLDTISPTIICPNDTTTCFALFDYTEPVGIDNCGGATTLQIDASGYSSGSVFPEGQTIIEYEVTDASSNTATCSFRVTILQYSDTANIVEDTISLCDINATLIDADELSSGDGEWSFITGSGVIGNENNFETVVNGIEDGVNVLVWNVTNSSGCAPSSDTLTILVGNTPTIANVGLNNLVGCQDTFDLSGNFPVSGEGLWEHIGGTATIEDVTLFNSLAYDMPDGANKFLWTISSPGCPSSSDTMYVTRHAQPTIANILTADTTICDSVDFITALAEAPDEGTGVWAVIEGVGSISDKDSTETTISLFAGGVNKYIWIVRNESCIAISDTLTINLEICGEFVDVPNLLTPNGDGKNDIWVIPYLKDFYEDCNVRVYNKWGGKVFESDGYTKAWDCKYKDEVLPAGAYFYTIDLGNGTDPLTGSLTLLK